MYTHTYTHTGAIAGGSPASAPHRVVCGLGKVIEVQIGEEWVRGEVLSTGGGKVKIRYTPLAGGEAMDTEWISSEWTVCLRV